MSFLTFEQRYYNSDMDNLYIILYINLMYVYYYRECSRNFKCPLPKPLQWIQKLNLCLTLVLVLILVALPPTDLENPLAACCGLHQAHDASQYEFNHG